ncbi:MAG: 6-phosphofructokinase [Anaerolineaceae bacterium]|nr:6-phosphofructokinase [Anaerolineaceae bacterium]
MKRIAVLTSGGDAPGMNAAIRAVTRTAISMGAEVFGVQLGYQGLIDGIIIPLGARDVAGIIQRGGTMLGSARCDEFKTAQGQREAIRNLHQHGIEGIVVIGGNGSQTGANALAKQGFPVVGVASTIDNDLYGSDITIGVDTALNIVLEAIDRLKVTASSHQRAFMIEVMGRNCGYLALMAGIAGGAETIVIPEYEVEPEYVAKDIARAYEKGKQHAIIIVAEGAKNNTQVLETYFAEHKEELGFSIRTTILGHVQRGGTPSASDRILASRLGSEAAKALLGGNHGVLIGMIKNELVSTPLEVVVEEKKELDRSWFEMAEMLDR